MKTKISQLIIALGSLVSTAILLVCLSVVTSETNPEIGEQVNTLLLAAQRILCLAVFSGFSADILLHKKAR